MELSQLTSRPPAGVKEECLGHEGTLNMLESWREILRDRQVRDEAEISQNSITVSVGPQFEGDISKSENINISYFINCISYLIVLSLFRVFHICRVDGYICVVRSSV